MDHWAEPLLLHQQFLFGDRRYFADSETEPDVQTGPMGAQVAVVGLLTLFFTEIKPSLLSLSTISRGGKV